MKLFQLKFSTLILRFYLIMAIVIVSFFAGYPILAILSLPVFISAMLGLQLRRSKNALKSTVRERSFTPKHEHQTAH